LNARHLICFVGFNDRDFGRTPSRANQSQIFSRRVQRRTRLIDQPAAHLGHDAAMIRGSRIGKRFKVPPWWWGSSRPPATSPGEDSDGNARRDLSANLSGA